jgi:hypothetical protein
MKCLEGEAWKTGGSIASNEGCSEDLLITTVHGTSRTKIAVNYTLKSQKQENANEKVQQFLMQF